jgi:hypothetical protein
MWEPEITIPGTSTGYTSSIVPYNAAGAARSSWRNAIRYAVQGGAGAAAVATFAGIFAYMDITSRSRRIKMFEPQSRIDARIKSYREKAMANFRKRKRQITNNEITPKKKGKFVAPSFSPQDKEKAGSIMEKFEKKLERGNRLTPAEEMRYEDAVEIWEAPMHRKKPKKDTKNHRDDSNVHPDNMREIFDFIRRNDTAVYRKHLALWKKRSMENKILWANIRY